MSDLLEPARLFAAGYKPWAECYPIMRELIAEIERLTAERNKIWYLLPNSNHLLDLAAKLDADGITVDGPICRVWASNLEEIFTILEEKP